MTMTTFQVNVSYSQIAVFLEGMEQPFNDWTDKHVEQGFAWRPGSVSFRTLDEAGAMEVTTDIPSGYQNNSEATRIIAVPFRVPSDTRVEVASIADNRPLDIPPGEYRLIFENGREAASAMWCRLMFERVDEPVSPEVLRADDALSPSEPLLMHADPA